MTPRDSAPGSMLAAAPARPAVSQFLASIAGHARAHPRSPALASVGRDGSPTDLVSYSQLAGWIGALADEIRVCAAPGETVMLMGPSSPRFVAWFCAALAAGVRLIPVHPNSTGAELAALAGRAGACGVIADPDRVAAALAHLPVLPFDAERSKSEGVSGMAAPGPPGAVVLQSSGTTGLPKLVLRESPSLDADAANVTHATRLSRGDVLLAAMPLSHSYGVDMLLATLHAGAALHILESFDGAALAEHLTSHATVFPGVPFAFEAIARLAPPTPPRRLRLAFAAGSPLPARVQRAFHDSWGLPLGQLYGATELGSVTFNDPASPLFHPESVGAAMPGVSIRVLDPDDPSIDLGAGKEGHVVIAAPSMLSDYLEGGAPRVDGHLLTGDMGVIDAAGRLFITGRLKLLIDVGGLKVNPLEVEAALSLHPAVAECAVAPLPLSDTVSRLRAIVVPRDPANPPTSEALRAFLKARLSPHKVPRVFDVATSLPRSATGKLLRQALGGAPR